ncbi:MAG: transposase domain-containing protein [Lachnospiraceae bacterium]|nr:transposase domain-containing protein [Lachnospiraceae bacterium]
MNPYYYLKYLLERIPELMNAEGASRKRPGTTATMVREPSGQMS